nr:hypothetical protein [Tanacetum cinerariifolium]
MKSPISNNVLMNLLVKHRIDSKIFFEPVLIMVVIFRQNARECLAIIESKSKVRYSRNKPVVAKVSTNPSTSGISPDVAELKDTVKALLLDKKSQNQSPAPVKAVEESCVTCGGAHSYRNCPATDGNVYRDNIQEFISQASAVDYNQGNTSYRPPMMSNQIRPPSFPLGNNFNQGPVYQPSVFQPPTHKAPAYQAPAPQTQGVSKEDFSAYVKANNAVIRNMQTEGQNMQNQLTNLTDLITKFVNSNSASTLSSGSLPSNTIANPRNEPEVTNDTVNTTNNGSTKDVQPQVVQSKSPVLTSNLVTSPISKPAIAPVNAPKLNPKSSIPHPSRRNDERNHEKANNQIEKFYKIFKDMSFEISFADALILMPKFASTLKALIGNKEKLSEMARTLLINTALRSRCISAIEDDPTYLEFYQTYLDPKGDILLLEAFLNDDPSLPPPNQGNYLPEVRKELKIYEAINR